MKSKQTKQTEATQRHTQRATLTPIQQLHKLDQTLGLNQGAKRERAKLHSQLSKTSE